jgi:geranylgeranyl transferase type-2 subunit beta
MTASYLERLSRQIADGLARLPKDFRSHHADYLIARQNPDGGFSGRQGGSDLYYTGFALRSLTALNALTAEICQRTAGFLRQSLSKQTSVVDFFSFLYSCLLVQTSGNVDVLADSATDWPERVAAMLETFRTPDGGYAKTPGGASSGSTYHTFLVGLTYQLLQRQMPRPAEIIRFVHSRQREDGGFVEVAPMRKSGTNPTAAAVGLLQLLNGGKTESPGPVPQTLEQVTDFLAAMPSDEGGFRANSRAPLADLLSTFTGVWTLLQLGAFDRLPRQNALHYVQALELPTGGFRGGHWDDATDVEYTFYGLGALAILTF